MNRRIGVIFLLMIFVASAVRGAEPTASGIPLLRSVNTIVVGGNSGALATALEAKKSGKNVLIITSYPYLGEDVLGTLRLWLEEGEVPGDDPISTAIYGPKDAEGKRTPPNIEQIRKSLDQAINDAKIPVMYKVSPAGYLKDMQRNNMAAGIVISTENGLAAIHSDTIIDSTPFGLAISRMQSYFTHRDENEGFADPPADPPKAEGNNNDIAVYEEIEYVAIGGKPREISREKYPLLCESSCETIKRPYIDEKGVEHPIYRYKIKIGRPKMYYTGGEMFTNYLCELDRQIREAISSPDTLMMAEDYFKIPGVRMQGMQFHDAEWTSADALNVMSFRSASGQSIIALSGYADMKRETLQKMLRPVNYIATGRAVAKSISRSSNSNIFHDNILAEIGKPEEAQGDGGWGKATRCMTRIPSKKTVVEEATGIMNRGHKCDILVLSDGVNGIDAARTAAAENASVILMLPDGVSADAYRKLAGTKVKIFPSSSSFAALCNLPESGKSMIGPIGKVCGVLSTVYNETLYVKASVVIDATKSATIARAAGAKYSGGYKDFELLFADELRTEILTGCSFGMTDFLNGRTYSDTIFKIPASVEVSGQYTLYGPPKNLTADCSVPLSSFIPKRIDGILVLGDSVPCEDKALRFLRSLPEYSQLESAVALAAVHSLTTKREPGNLRIRDLQKRLLQAKIIPESVLKEMDNERMLSEKLEQAIAELPQKNELLPLVLWKSRDSLAIINGKYDKEGQPEIHTRVRAILGDPSLDNETAIRELGEMLDTIKGWNEDVPPLLILLGDRDDPKVVEIVRKKLEELQPGDDLPWHIVCFKSLENMKTEAASKVLFENAKRYAKPNNEREACLSVLNAGSLYRCGDIEHVGLGVLNKYRIASNSYPFLSQLAIETLNAGAE